MSGHPWHDGPNAEAIIRANRPDPLYDDPEATARRILAEYNAACDAEAVPR